MDDYEQLFRDGLRQAAASRPPLRIDLDEFTSGVGEDLAFSAQSPPLRATGDSAPTAEPVPLPASDAPGLKAERVSLTASDEDAHDAEPALLTVMPSVTHRRSGVRWMIGLSAAAAAAAVLIVVPGLVSQPVTGLPADPAPTVTAAPVPGPAPAPSSEPATRWAMPSTIAPDDLPLSPYWDAIRRAQEYEDSLDRSPEVRMWWDDREAYLTACMAKQGWDYFPRLRSWGPEPGSEAAAYEERLRQNRLRIPTLDADRGVVAEIGYGLRSAGDLGWDYEAEVDDSQNSDYFAALSAAEQGKYQASMNDCLPRAYRTYPDPTEQYRDDFIANQFDIVSELGAFRGSMGDKADIEADSRIVELNTEWRACMSAAGVPVEEARARAKKPGPWDGPIEAMQIAARTGADGVAAELGDQEPDRIDQQSLIGSEPEIRIALADYDCRAATDYVSRFVAVQREREQSFLEANRVELDELLTYVESQVP